MDSPNFVIIRDAYGIENAAVQMDELDQALEANTQTIIIEPTKLGVIAGRWISIGNFLHKIAVVSGLGCIGVTIFGGQTTKLIVPLGFSSVFCVSFYMVSWQGDPCCKYQVESDHRRLEKLPFHRLNTPNPVVLVRKDDTRRKILHNVLAASSLVICCWKLRRHLIAVLPW